MSKIIKFEDVKDRHKASQREADLAEQRDLYHALIQLLCKSQLEDSTLSALTLSVLLGVLEAGGLNNKKARLLIARELFLL